LFGDESGLRGLLLRAQGAGDLVPYFPPFLVAERAEQGLVVAALVPAKALAGLSEEEARDLFALDPDGAVRDLSLRLLGPEKTRTSWAVFKFFPAKELHEGLLPSPGEVERLVSALRNEAARLLVMAAELRASRVE